ncbi:ankyrin repeat domain-containing protein [Arenibacter sp. GZD96]|uniref:ankyrin repeat domain-containing protein n=1 Tax=Aurantibrevibacter litoralis TaxID=3106030 RepID=UPI002AFFE474|nr:ankyrin repeat domain-containing protein [Arenibacter sp. GZD-96]MEA1786002.1 ankyrin repeat domain-containing protein [Arenibacter sp. GZD-96]
MKELIEIIKIGDNNQLANKLDQDPSLADSKTEQGISILQFAAYCRNMEAVQIIRRHKSHLDIFEAATLGEVERVKQLLEEKPELLNDYSNDGFTLLGLAAFFGHLDLAQELLEKGADPNIAANNQFKVAPIHSACATSNLEMAVLLIKNGADVNAKQMQNVTPAHSAAHNGQTELVQLLFDNKADINAKMENGQTPLSMAEEAKFKETADYIRKLGGK